MVTSKPDKTRLYWTDDEPTPSSTTSSASPADGAALLAKRWLSQVDARDALPRRMYERKYVRFSPSQADDCLRKLYYVNTNAEVDETPQVAWKTRRARNGTGCHDKIQRDNRWMVGDLRTAGIAVDFERIGNELDGTATYNVNGYSVVIEGRCDELWRYVGEPITGVAETNDVAIVDYKFKDKLSGIGKIDRYGVPSYNKAQMDAYTLLTFKTPDGVVIDRPRLSILHYESLQKPKENEEASKDVKAVVVQTTDADRNALLVRFAKVAEAIERGVVPPKEDKCFFCAYKERCSADGETA